jgi:hypothetical protein
MAQDARKQDAKREANRAKKIAADPVYAERRKRQFEAADKKRGRPYASSTTASFVGCDGEGVRDGSRSAFALFRMGDRELYKGPRERLTTPELLAFILDEPAGTIPVGFFFDYDINNILADVPREPDKGSIPGSSPGRTRLERVLRVNDGGLGRMNDWTWLNFEGHPTYGVNWLPRNHLKVCLARTLRMPDGRIKRQAAPGSTRTIYEGFGNFQKSFMGSLKDWQIGAEDWPELKRMKDTRSTFAAIDDEIRRYNSIECVRLAELMEQFRAMSLAAGIKPRTWNGAGKLAAAMLKKHGVMTRKELEAITPKPVLDLADEAYYGGRFEITRVGRLPPTWEHDINSAYPAGMLKLPCLEHGQWIKRSGPELAALPDDAIYVCPIAFSHPRDQFLCGFPFRAKSGGLSWPRHGRGVYWSPETRSAIRLGATAQHFSGWEIVKKCQCKPFDWVEDYYETRRAIGKGRRGLPIKLGLNSLAGKFAQRLGSRTWGNKIWAGLITANTRATLNDAIRLVGPRNVAMIATDAIYTTGKRAPVKAGPLLGQWEVNRHPSLFIVKPGLYWPPKPQNEALRAWKFKTRGLSPKFFEKAYKRFEAAWRAYLPHFRDWSREPPAVPVPVDVFVGLKLAYRQNKLDRACQWGEMAFNHSFNWSKKREGAALDGKGLRLGSPQGSAAAYSAPYKPRNPDDDDPFDEMHEYLGQLPDALDLGPLWGDK